MGWKAIAFGTDTPSNRAYVMYALLYPGMASAFHGMYCDFVPNPIFMGSNAFFAFLLLGVLLTIALVASAIARGRMQLLGFKAFLGLLIFPCLLGASIWLIVAKSVPWLITIAVGESHEDVAVLRTHYSYHRRSCDYRLEGEYLQQTYPSYLCIGRPFYLAYPEQLVLVKLSGERTILGFRIARIESVVLPVPVSGQQP